MAKDNDSPIGYPQHFLASASSDHISKRLASAGHCGKTTVLNLIR